MMRNKIVGLLAAFWAAFLLPAEAQTYLATEPQVFHSKAYGAVGNSTADDTAALQKWINDCQAAPGAGTICFLDSGFYKITAELAVSNCINIDGAGRAQSQILPFNGTQNGLHITTNCSYGRVANIAILPQVSKTGGSAILLDAGVANNGWAFQNLYITGDFNGITATANATIFFMDNNTIGCSNLCLQITASGDSAITNSFIANNGNNSIGVNCTNCDGLKISNTKIINSTGTGTAGIVWVGTSSCTSCSDFLLSNLSVEQNGGTALLVQQNTTVSMANVIVSGGEYASGAGSAIIIANDSNSWLQNVVITGALLSGNSGTPVLIIGSASRVTVDGNTINGNSAATFGAQIGSVSTFCSWGINSISGTTTGYINDQSGICQKSGLTLLNTFTASSSAAFTDNAHLTSEFQNYVLTFDQIVPVSNAVSLLCQNIEGGVTQVTTYINAAGGVTSGIDIGQGATVVNTGGYGISGSVEIHSATLGTSVKTWEGHASNNTATTATNVSVSGFRNAAATLNGLTCKFSSGNISTGTFRLYGKR